MELTAWRLEMGRSKKTPFPEWQTRKPNGIEERFVRVGNSQLLHESTMGLTNAEFRLYIYMLNESGGKREFTMPRSKYKNFLSPHGAQSAIYGLEKKGFIDIVEKNGNLRKANVYRFSTRWKDA